MEEEYRTEDVNPEETKEEAISAEDEILQLVSFELMSEPFAVNVSCVQEIIRCQEITDVPHTDDHVLGVINLRGHIIPVIDLKIKFGMEASEQTVSSRVVIVNVNNIVVGMLVDSVSEVIRLNESAIEPPSPVIGSVDSDFLKGVGRQGDKMILLLDIDKILQTKNRSNEFDMEIAGLIED